MSFLNTIVKWLKLRRALKKRKSRRDAWLKNKRGMFYDAISATLGGCPNGAVFFCPELNESSVWTSYRANRVPLTKEDMMHLDWFKVDTTRNFNNIHQLDDNFKRKALYG